MVPFLAILLITFLIVFLVSRFVIVQFEMFENHKALQATIIAVTAALVTILTDTALVKIATPNIFIKTRDNGNSIDIQFQTKKSVLGFGSGIISYISLEYPVTGVIQGFRDHNSKTQAETSAFVIGDSDARTYLNHLELSIEKIEPYSTLNYTILYKPAVNPPKLQLKQVGQTWPECYKIRYVWRYKWDEFNVTQWRLVKNDQVTDLPQYRLWTVKFSKSPKYPDWIAKRQLK